MAATRRRPPSLVRSVDRAVKEMHWLTPADQALVDVARRYARQIEDAQDAGGDVAWKMVGWLGPHLVHALKALGGSPAERQALGVDREVKGRLAELREARERRGA